MTIDDKGDVSGRIIPEETIRYTIDNSITDMEEIPSAGYNRLVKAVRYGKHFMLKGLKAQYRNDPTFRAMLRKEFEIMVLMNHPNIVRVYTLEEVDGIGLCIVMEYVDGMPLDDWLATHPSAHLRLRVVHQLLDAMIHGHSHQVVHRDLKPSNLLVTRNGSNLRIIDFGLADADQYAILKEPAYTLCYASPEQLQGGELDCRSDIYSFGRILSQIFPHRYAGIVARCCRQRREQRYPSVEAVQAAFRRRKILNTVAILAILAGVATLYALAFHYSSRPFSYKVADAQVLRMQIKDSQAKIIGVDTLAGDLQLPERVRRGLFTYPLREIDKKAFLDCRLMTHITFPSTLRRIEDKAFMSCSGLRDTLVLPEGLTYLGDEVFNSCENISVCRVESQHLHLKEDPDIHGRFVNTNKMHTVIVDGAVDTLCEELFQWAYFGIHDVYLEEGLTHLGNGSFAELYYLERIHFPTTLRCIDKNCFYGCGIKRLVIPDWVEVIEDYAFACLFNCTYVEVGSNVRYIGSNAFYDWRHSDTLIFRGLEPPVVEGTAFTTTTGTVNAVPTVLVPAAALDRYLQDSLLARLHPIGY